jgi:hypothetical protein
MRERNDEVATLRASQLGAEAARALDRRLEGEQRGLDRRKRLDYLTLPEAE